MADITGRLLIIDDSAEDRTTHRRYLERDSTACFTFYEAETGAEGLAICREQVPDCILLDFHLPDMDGVDFLKELADDPRIAQIAVIVLTGLGNEAVAVQSIKSGAYDYISKNSVTPEQLRGMVRASIGQSQIQRAIATQAEHLLAQERQLQMIWDQVSIAMTLTDPNGLILAINPACEALFGYSAAELVGKSFTVSYPPDQRAEAEAAYETVFANADSSLSIERMLLRSDGSEITVESNIAFLMEDGQRRAVLSVIRDVTARARAERALRESENRLRLALDAARMGSWDWDIVHNQLTWSGTMERSSGLPPDHFPENVDDLEALIYPADRALFQQAIQQSLVNDTAYDVEFRSLRKDGGIRWSHTRGLVIRDEEGKPVRMVGIDMDITDRRMAIEEIELRDRAINASNDGIAICDATNPEQPLIYCNPAFEQITGYRRDEVIGRNCRFLQGPDTDRETIAKIHTALQQEQSIQTVIKNYRKDGTPFWNQLSIAPVRDSNGQLTHFVGSVLDVTANRRAEEAAALFAETSRALADSLDYETTLQTVARLPLQRFADYCVVHIAGDDGIVRIAASTHIDPAKEALLAQLANTYAHPLNDPDNPISTMIRRGESSLHRSMPQGLLQDELSPEIVAIVNRDFTIETSISVPLTARGQCFGLITLISSAPGKRYSNEDLELMEEVARRCALALDNARLYAMAQEAIRLRDTFFSIAAHELRTPITTLQGHIQLLQRRITHESATSERNQRSLQVIRDQIGRLNQMISDLLDTARIEAGQMRLDPTRIDIVALIRQIVAEIEPTINNHELRLTTTLSSLGVQADALRIEQVFQNLISNAVKYSPNGGLIEIGIRDEGVNAAVSIRDHGIGIPKAGFEQLFQRFYRASNVGEHQIKGLGIGLYVSKQIIEAHGGTINVASELGAGTTFTVLLPINQQ